MLHKKILEKIVAFMSLASTNSSSFAEFRIKDTFIGPDFFSDFIWETFDDPTHGNVNYVNMTYAMARNLSFASHDKFIMGADHHSTIPDINHRGRDSIRIRSRASYNDSLAVLDLERMPEGCGTWPAFWSVSEKGPWPYGGEFDIIEGANLQASNIASLHTTANCTMPYNRDQTGRTLSTDCNVAANQNQGCNVQFDDQPLSFGSAFNNARGGWFAFKRKQVSGASVFFWSRGDPSVPPSVKLGTNAINTSDWGTPSALFPIDSCNFWDHFDAHHLIFDLTFCGDLGTATWNSSGCGPGSCKSLAFDHPEAFSSAHWVINSLRVYTT